MTLAIDRPLKSGENGSLPVTVEVLCTSSSARTSGPVEEIRQLFKIVYRPNTQLPNQRQNYTTSNIQGGTVCVCVSIFYFMSVHIEVILDKNKNI